MVNGNNDMSMNEWLIQHYACINKYSHFKRVRIVSSLSLKNAEPYLLTDIIFNLSAYRAIFE